MSSVRRRGIRVNLSKEQILAAMAVTQSNKQAARRLHVSYDVYKREAKQYETFPGSGITLFDQHKATPAGIPRYSNRRVKEVPIEEIIEGRADGTQWPIQDIKDKLLSNQFLNECCGDCGYKERRVKDYRIPLLLTFRDGNRRNFLLENLAMLCYNCYFLQFGDIFNSIDHDHIEGHIPLEGTSELVDFEVDDYMRKRFRELGIADEEEDDPDGLNEIISRS